MKFISKMPLYLGLSVFVIAVMVSVVKVGEQGSIPLYQSQAASNKAKLSLVFTAPNLIRLELNSEKEVSGIDVVLKFDKTKISVLSSTLTAGSSFIATGGNTDDDSGLFSFSALPKLPNVSSGVVASFNIIVKDNSGKADTLLQFVKGENKTAVIEKVSNAEISVTTQDVSISL